MISTSLMPRQSLRPVLVPAGSVKPRSFTFAQLTTKSNIDKTMTNLAQHSGSLIIIDPQMTVQRANVRMIHMLSKEIRMSFGGPQLDILRFGFDWLCSGLFDFTRRSSARR